MPQIAAFHDVMRAEDKNAWKVRRHTVNGSNLVME